MAQLKVCIIDGSNAYRDMFLSFGHSVVNDINVADIVCFTGGADVDPSYYGQVKHQRTISHPDRDRREQLLYNVATQKDKPMVGICRGAQFLNVMNGGQMYQDVTEHCGSHMIHDVYHNERYKVTSTHHQMMMPTPHAEVIGYAEHLCDREWMDDGSLKKDSVEFGYEILFYRNTRSLCYQPHPEMTLGSPMRLRFKSLVENLLMMNRPQPLVLVK